MAVDHSSVKPPIEKNQDPDIYTRALEFLTKKKLRLNQQRVQHHRILQQYRQKLGIPQVVKVSDQNARYTYVGLDATNGNHTIDIGVNDSSIPQKRSGLHSIKPVDDKEIDELTHTIADMTLDNDTDASPRANSGRSIGGSSIFSKFTSVLDFGRVVREIETSVMSSVSCTACRAGN